MFHLKLIKSRSYTGVVHATAERPDVFVDDEETANAAVATGYFTLCTDGTPATPPKEPSTGTINATDTMNANQLRVYIKKNALDVDLPTGTSAADLRKAIAEAQEDKEADATAQFAAQDPEEDPADGTPIDPGAQADPADGGNPDTNQPPVSPTGAEDD